MRLPLWETQQRHCGREKGDPKNISLPTITVPRDSIWQDTGTIRANPFREDRTLPSTKAPACPVATRVDTPWDVLGTILEFPFVLGQCIIGGCP